MLFPQNTKVRVAPGALAIVNDECYVLENNLFGKVVEFIPGNHWQSPTLYTKVKCDKTKREFLFVDGPGITSKMVKING
jgi:hypothetical protein